MRACSPGCVAVGILLFLSSLPFMGAISAPASSLLISGTVAEYTYGRSQYYTDLRHYVQCLLEETFPPWPPVAGPTWPPVAGPLEALDSFWCRLQVVSK